MKPPGNIRKVRDLLRSLAILFAALLFGPVASVMAASPSVILYMTEIPGQTMIDEVTPGVGLEIMRLVAKRAGITLEERFLPWKRAVRTVELSEDGIIIPFGQTPNRERRFRWIGKLYDLQFGFVSFDQGVDSFDQARGLKRIGVWRGSSMEEELRDNGFKNLVAVSDASALLRMLAKDRIVAWYGSLQEAAYQLFAIEQVNQAKVRFGKVLNSYPAWLASGPKFPSHISDALAEALETLRAQGEIRKLTEAYYYQAR